MSNNTQPASLACLVLAAGDERWLVPASLVAEVMAHFDEHVPETLDWRDRQLPCLNSAGSRVRALAVLRRVSDSSGGFYALALRETPRPVQVYAGTLETGAQGWIELAWQRVRVFDTDIVEARLPPA